MSEFKVMGKLGMDGAGFFSTMKKAEQSVQNLGKYLAGAFSVGAITAFSKSVLDLAGKLNDVSSALAINVEFLQRFVASAAKSGGSLSDVEKFIFESNKSRQAALNKPGGAEAAAFRSLGFSSSDVAQLNPQQFIEKLIDAFSGGITPQKINALAEIGGKAAKNLVNGFAEGIDTEIKIINEELVYELDEIGDKFTSLANEIKSAFAPAIKYAIDFFQGIVDMTKAVSAFYGTLIGGGSLADAETARDEELLAQVKRDKTIEEVSRARRASRKAGEQSSPGFAAQSVELEPKSASGKSKSSIYSDSLLSVGNFLGSGRASSLETIGTKQLNAQLKMVELLKGMSAGNGGVPMT
jgi:hypothetical protein